MSETQNNMQEQKPETYKLAKWSLGLAIVGSLSIIVLFPIGILYLPLGIIPSIIGILGLPIAVILGIISIFKIKKSRGQLKGMGLAIGGIAIPVTETVIILAVAMMIVRPLFYRIVCGMNMEGLGAVIEIYASDNDGEYPTPDKWCDLLVEHVEITEKAFRCRGAGKGQSHYAMNPNAGPNSPNDVVLLFETKGGWNQFGGPKILTFDNHKGKGCFVLFNDCRRVDFIKPEEVEESKWKAEEGK